MRLKRKSIVCIDSESEFLNNQKKFLVQKHLQDYFYPFSDFLKAIHFVEDQIVSNSKKLHYILIDERVLRLQMADFLERLSAIYSSWKKLEIIILTQNNSDELRNRIMQFPFISAFIIKPIPEDYFEFLISGKINTSAAC